MKTSLHYITYGVLAVLVGSIASSAFLNIRPSYALDANVTVTTDSIVYKAGYDVVISGSISQVDSNIKTAKITITPPSGSSVNYNAELYNGGNFDYDYKLSSGATEGRYKVKVTYGTDIGYTFFKVKDSVTDAVSVLTADDTYQAGDSVDISGKVAQLTSGEDSVDIVIIGPDDKQIKSLTADLDVRDYGTTYRLSSSAAPGRYTVEVTYAGDDGVAIFEVEDQSSDGSSSGSGSTSSGSGSGTSSGTSTPTSTSLTAVLDKSSYLAGDIIKVTGKVPKIVSDQTVNIDVYKPDKTYAGASSSADPASDLTFTATIRLPAGLPSSDQKYEVKINYNGDEIVKQFSITGVSSDLPITVNTDKAKYSQGGTVVISGKISRDLLVDGVDMVIKVVNPEKAPYRIDIVKPASDGSYSYSLVLGGKLATPGLYEITVSYNQKNGVKATFELSGGSTGSGRPVYSLKAGDKTYFIEYEITNAALKSMFIKAQDKRLAISVDASSDGQLIVVLPRKVIDSLGDEGSDKKYVVLASDLDNGSDQDVLVNEIKTDDPTTRTLKINFAAGTDIIEIAGTTVVPEFGPLSAVILAIAIMTIIAFSARYANKFGGLSPFKSATG